MTEETAVSCKNCPICSQDLPFLNLEFAARAKTEEIFTARVAFAKKSLTAVGL